MEHPTADVPPPLNNHQRAPTQTNQTVSSAKTLPNANLPNTFMLHPSALSITPSLPPSTMARPVCKPHIKTSYPVSIHREGPPLSGTKYSLFHLITSRCYSVNRYKPLQNRLLQKLLQTITNSYKPLQTSYSAKRYEPLQTVTNRYKTFTP